MSLRLLRVLPLLALLAGCSPQIGNKCTLSTDCSQLGDRLCDTNQPAGYCTVFNCEPDQCPNSICVAFDPLLDPSCGAAVDGRWPRFQRSFCLATCNSNSDCRDQYECVDLSVPHNQTARSAQVVDLGAGDGGFGYKVCMSATCGDGIQDGNETDVDCGGNVCSLCNNGKRCNSSNDCFSGSCRGSICVGASCANGVKDATETDVDCGGTECAACSGGQACVLGSDCRSALCLSSACLPGDCANGIKDPGSAETDVDCGGGGCQKCALGQGCGVDSDCTTGSCSNMRCVPPPPPPVCSTPNLTEDAGAWPQYTPAYADAGTD